MKKSTVFLLICATAYATNKVVSRSIAIGLSKVLDPDEARDILARFDALDAS